MRVTLRVNLSHLYVYIAGYIETKPDYEQKQQTTVTKQKKD
eukprot:UN06934